MPISASSRSLRRESSFRLRTENADGCKFMAGCVSPYRVTNSRNPMSALRWPRSVALFAVLILATLDNSGRSALILNFAPFFWLGDISYSLYLIHGFVQFLTTRLLEAIGVYDRAHLTAGVSF